MLEDRFASETFAETEYAWSRHKHDLSICEAELLAAAVADRIVEERCAGARQHYDVWKAKHDSGTPLTPPSTSALRAFLGPAVGLADGSMTVAKDHLEGLVAEQLWYELVAHCPQTEEVVYLEPPSFALTAPGGDGLAIHRLEDSMLRFRLWEIKKSVGESGIRPTVSKAYGQLATRAAIYLAQYSHSGEGRFSSTELNAFYGQLTDLWLSGSPQASAGVSVATSFASLIDDAFVKMPEKFSTLREPNRLRGMLTALEDLPGFSELVQMEIWKGL